jgi:hypothetical protein
MAKKPINKIADKLNKVNESFSVNMYDNGFMIEVSGRDSNNEYKTAKVMVGTIDELIALVKEVSGMERDE